MMTEYASEEKASFSPKTFTTHPKNGKRKPSKKKAIEDSIAKSIPFFNDSAEDNLKLFEGELVHLSFDCPKKLREAFNQATKGKGASACFLRVFMAAYVRATYEENKYGKKHALSNTIFNGRPTIVIEKLETNQYVQTRPRRLIRQTQPRFLTADGSDTCEIGNPKCGSIAVGKAVYLENGTEYWVCRVHQENCSNYPKMWRLL